MSRLLCALTVFFTMSSCEASYTPPYLTYKAKFDVTNVDKAENAVKEIAKKWNLRVYEKDRGQMKNLTQGKDAFFIALYFNKDPVLSLANVGVGEVLTLMVHDYGHMPVGDLEQLNDEVIKTLETQLDIEFKKSEG